MQSKVLRRVFRKLKASKKQLSALSLEINILERRLKKETYHDSSNWQRTLQKLYWPRQHTPLQAKTLLRIWFHTSHQSWGFWSIDQVHNIRYQRTSTARIRVMEMAIWSKVKKEKQRKEKGLPAAVERATWSEGYFKWENSKWRKGLSTAESESR